MSNGDKQMKYDAPEGFRFLVIDTQTDTVAAVYNDRTDAEKQAGTLNAGFPGRYWVHEQE
jgi:hypothetical protein